MDLKRILTTVLGLPSVILVFIFCNKYVIDTVFMVAAIICMYEYMSVVKKVAHPIEWIAYVSTFIIVLTPFLDVEYVKNIVLIGIPFIFMILFIKVIITDMKTTFKDVAYTLLGIVYIVTFILFLSLIMELENGKILIGYIFVVAWATDIFAYLIGKKFGKHKFSKVSPKKSIEGCIAGILGAVVVATLYTIIINKSFGVNYSCLILSLSAVIFSIISQVGDFTASSIKRFADVKDYGNLLPGHGGMLDRIDSLIFIAPFVYLMFLMV